MELDVLHRESLDELLDAQRLDLGELRVAAPDRAAAMREVTQSQIDDWRAGCAKRAEGSR